MRTTIDIDDPILKDLKRMQKRQGKSLGRLVSDLLAQSISVAKQAPVAVPVFSWTSRPMAARMPLHDKPAMLDAMDCWPRA